jgi:hypothetical protein
MLLERSQGKVPSPFATFAGFSSTDWTTQRALGRNFFMTGRLRREDADPAAPGQGSATKVGARRLAITSTHLAQSLGRSIHAARFPVRSALFPGAPQSSSLEEVVMIARLAVFGVLDLRPNRQWDAGS